MLVVDDERGPRESLRMILAPRHHVLLASSGAETLERLRETDVDVLTLDLNMPGMRGEELLRRVRQTLPGIEIIVITGYGSLKTATEGIRYSICDYIQKPFDVAQVVAAVERAAGRQRSRHRLGAFLHALRVELGGDAALRARLGELPRGRELLPALDGPLAGTAPAAPAADLADQTRTLRFLQALVQSIETASPTLSGHSRRVAFHAGLLAERTGLAEAQREDVRTAALLHDLGKLVLPRDVLDGDRPATDEERERARRHPEIGATLGALLELPEAVLEGIAHHHARWDGCGEARALRGEDIPLAARMLAIADSYDVLTCGRPGRLALGQRGALSELERRAGSELDGGLVKEFATIIESFASGLDLELLTDAVCESKEVASNTGRIEEHVRGGKPASA